MGHLRTFGMADRGQSLVEIALTLPVLLITLLGMVDAGRAYLYSTAVTNAAREAAYYAAKTSGATLANVALRACNETGFSDYTTTAPSVSGSTATCTSGATVTSGTCSTGATGDVVVEVAYQFDLVSGYLFKSLLGHDHLTARGTACFRSLT